MNNRIANLYLTARRAGVCMDEALPHFHDMLQSVIHLCQACELPLHYRFRPTPHAPVSQQLKVDHATYLENPGLYTTATSGRDLFRGYSRMVDPVRDLKAMAPRADQVLQWMQAASAIHFTSNEYSSTYERAADRLLHAPTGILHTDSEDDRDELMEQLVEPLLAAMERCGIMPRWKRPLALDYSV